MSWKLRLEIELTLNFQRLVTIIKLSPLMLILDDLNHTQPMSTNTYTDKRYL
jgi:hypothetical protein